MSDLVHRLQAFSLPKMKYANLLAGLLIVLTNVIKLSELKGTKRDVQKISEDQSVATISEGSLAKPREFLSTLVILPLLWSLFILTEFGCITSLNNHLKFFEHFILKGLYLILATAFMNTKASTSSVVLTVALYPVILWDIALGVTQQFWAPRPNEIIEIKVSHMGSEKKKDPYETFPQQESGVNQEDVSVLLEPAQEQTI